MLTDTALKHMKPKEKNYKGGPGRHVCAGKAVRNPHFSARLPHERTLLNELGFNSDWIEKCLAHEDGCSSRGVYNKAEYEVQRRHMMQEWSNIIDAWVAGQKYAPVLIPPSMPLLELDPALSPAESAVA